LVLPGTLELPQPGSKQTIYLLCINTIYSYGPPALGRRERIVHLLGDPGPSGLAGLLRRQPLRRLGLPDSLARCADDRADDRADDCAGRVRWRA
jgi:hypothetical protein